jgi:hypothetical protein
VRIQLIDHQAGIVSHLGENHDGSKAFAGSLDQVQEECDADQARQDGDYDRKLRDTFLDPAKSRKRIAVGEHEGAQGQPDMAAFEDSGYDPGRELAACNLDREQHDAEGENNERQQRSAECSDDGSRPVGPEIHQGPPHTVVDRAY